MSGFAIWKRSGWPLRFQIAGSAGRTIQCTSVSGVSADFLWAKADGDGSVEVLVDGNSTAVHRVSPSLPIDLQYQVPVLHGVVAVHGSLSLN